MQYDIVKAIAAASNSLTIVGDPDQSSSSPSLLSRGSGPVSLREGTDLVRLTHNSVYGWRNAEIANLEKMLSGASDSSRRHRAEELTVRTFECRLQAGQAGLLGGKLSLDGGNLGRRVGCRQAGCVTAQWHTPHRLDVLLTGPERTYPGQTRNGSTSPSQPPTPLAPPSSCTQPRAPRTKRPLSPRRSDT